MSYSVCPACRLPADSALSSLPCSDCRESLLLAPRICALCLGFSCPEDECTRPWIRVEGDPDAPIRFTSIHAAYLSIGPGFKVLKSWKTTRNPALERFLFEGLRHALTPFESSEEITLIPIPQTATRRWELHGGSTLRLCEMITRCRREKSLKTKILELLRVRPTESQAKTKGDERYRKKPSFEWIESSRNDATALSHPEKTKRGKILLIDDFLTSGTTLRVAATTLRAFHRKELHAFVLGFRPTITEF